MPACTSISSSTAVLRLKWWDGLPVIEETELSYDKISYFYTHYSSLMEIGPLLITFLLFKYWLHAQKGVNLVWNTGLYMIIVKAYFWYLLHWTLQFKTCVVFSLKQHLNIPSFIWWRKIDGSCQLSSIFRTLKNHSHFERLSRLLPMRCDIEWAL